MKKWLDEYKNTMKQYKQIVKESESTSSDYERINLLKK